MTQCRLSSRCGFTVHCGVPLTYYGHISRAKELLHVLDTESEKKVFWTCIQGTSRGYLVRHTRSHDGWWPVGPRCWILQDVAMWVLSLAAEVLHFSLGFCDWCSVISSQCRMYSHLIIRVRRISYSPCFQTALIFMVVLWINEFFVRTINWCLHLYNKDI